MDQIITIPINFNSVSETETETEIKNLPPRPIPTFDSFVSMIDSFTQLPTPLPLPLLCSEPEPDPVNYFGIPNNFEGNEYDQVQLDTVDHSFGLGLGLGFEGEKDLYDHNDKAILPSSGYDQLPINTNTQFNSPSPINSFSHTDTPLHQLDAYSPINQFAHTEYTLPPATYTLPPAPLLPTDLDQSPFLPEVVDSTPFIFDTHPPQPEHLAVSPTGHWTPITTTSQLPSQELGYLYKSFPPPQSQVAQYIQDLTPTLAPHYPDYEFDSGLEMTNDPFQSHYNWDQVRTVTPISTTDHRPIVSCRPTMKFSLPSALGDSVHDPETFGLKAEPIGGVDSGVRFPTPGERWSHLPPLDVTNWRNHPPPLDITNDGPSSNLPTPRSYWRGQIDGRERPDLKFDNGDEVGLGRSGCLDSLARSRDQQQHPFESRPFVNDNGGQVNGFSHRDDPSINGYSNRNRISRHFDIDNDPITRPRSLAPQKIHPRPTHTHPPSSAQHHLSNFSQPPPHTYTPMSDTKYYPPTPITSYHPPPQHGPGNPILPGVHHLFDRHLQLNNHTYTASPSTIFPNAKQYSHPIETHTHQISNFQRRDLRSIPQDTRVEMYNVGMNGQEIGEIESTSPDHISIDQEMSRTDSGSEESFESEEGEGGDDIEEVLSEYEPGKTKSKSKGKNKNKDKSKGKDQSRNMEKSQEKNVLKKHSEIIMKKMERDAMKVPQKVQGRSMAGYEFIWEGGIAYTDDAELKQTKEVRRRCHNCNTRSPPSWRKSNLVPGKILCNKCGIYERTHNEPRPQQQDEMKLRRNPTPPPSLGGYEPLEYDDDIEEEEDSSPASHSQYSPRISSSVIDIATSPHAMEVEVDYEPLERHHFEESVCRDERIQITPIHVEDCPTSPQIQVVQPSPLSFPAPTTQASGNETISFSQPQSQLQLDASLNIESRQLPPLRTFWNSQPTSGSGSVLPSPTTPSTGNGSDVINSIGQGNGNSGWEGKIASTPYSRPGSRSDLRSVSTTSLRGVDSGRW